MSYPMQMQIAQNLGLIGGNDGNQFAQIGGGESLAQSFNLNKINTPLFSFAGYQGANLGDVYNNSNLGMTGGLPYNSGVNPLSFGLPGMGYGMVMSPEQLSQYERQQDAMMNMSERQTERTDEFNMRRLNRRTQYDTRYQALKQNADLQSQQIQRARELEQQLILRKAEELRSKIIDNRKDEIVGKFKELVEKIKKSPEYQRRIVLPNGSTKVAPPTEEMATKLAMDVYNSQYGDLESDIKNNLAGSGLQGIKRIWGLNPFADRENADSIWAKINHGGKIEAGDRFWGGADIW